MVNNSKASYIARYAIMLATILVAVLLDKSITLGLPIAGATFELLVTLSFCFLLNSWLDGFLSTVFMGLSSFIWSFPFSNVASQNPLISVLPRVFVGIIAFCAYRLILLATRKAKHKAVCQIAAITVSAFCGLVANTVLYLGALSVFGEGYGSFATLLKGVAILNILPEYLVSLLGCASVVLGVRRGLKLGIDGNNWRVSGEDERDTTNEPSKSFDGESAVSDTDENDRAALTSDEAVTKEQKDEEKQ